MFFLQGMTTNSPNQIFFADSTSLPDPAVDDTTTGSGTPTPVTANAAAAVTAPAACVVAGPAEGGGGVGGQSVETCTVHRKPSRRRPCPVNGATAAAATLSSAAGGATTVAATETPMYPPSPMIDHLTPDEIKALNDVFSRMEQFDEEETRRISKLQQDVVCFEERVSQQQGSQLTSSIDLRLCRLCFKNKFNDGVGRVCVSCRRRVCNKCGSLSRWRFDDDNNKEAKARWRCALCHMRRELAAASGVWFHGGLAQPLITSTTFKKKLYDDCTKPSSDVITGREARKRQRTRTDGLNNLLLLRHRPLSTNISDSELNRGRRSTSGEGQKEAAAAAAAEEEEDVDEEDEEEDGDEDDLEEETARAEAGGAGAGGCGGGHHSLQRRHSSRRQKVTSSSVEQQPQQQQQQQAQQQQQLCLYDEDEDQENDEKFLREREKCRQERLQMQHKKTKKRTPRRASVGTCTMEDMIINEGDYSRLTDGVGPAHGVPSAGTTAPQGRASSETRASSSTGVTTPAAHPRRSPFDDRTQTKRCCRSKGSGDQTGPDEWLRVPDEQGHSCSGGSGGLQRRPKLNRSESETSSLSAGSSSKPLHRLKNPLGGGGVPAGSLSALKAMSSAEDVGGMYATGRPDAEVTSRGFHYLTLAAAGHSDHHRSHCSRASPGLQGPASGERVRRNPTETADPGDLDRSGQRRRRSRKVYVLRHIHSTTNIETKDGFEDGTKDEGDERATAEEGGQDALRLVVSPRRCHHSSSEQDSNQMAARLRQCSSEHEHDALIPVDTSELDVVGQPCLRCSLSEHEPSTVQRRRHASSDLEPPRRRKSQPLIRVMPEDTGTRSSAGFGVSSATAGPSGGGGIPRILRSDVSACSDDELDDLLVRLHKGHKGTASSSPAADASTVGGGATGGGGPCSILDVHSPQRKMSSASQTSERRKSSNASLSDWRKLSSSSVLSMGSFASSYRDYQRKFSNSSGVSTSVSRRPSSGSRTSDGQRKFSDPVDGFRRKSSDPGGNRKSSDPLDRRTLPQVGVPPHHRHLSRSSEIQRRRSSALVTCSGGGGGGGGVSGGGAPGGMDYPLRKMSVTEATGVDGGEQSLAAMTMTDCKRMLSKSDVLPRFKRPDQRPRKLSESAVLALIREKSSSRDDSEYSSSLKDGTARRSSNGNYFNVALQRDPNDKSCRTGGFGMRVVGGKQGPDKKLGTFVTNVIKGGPADAAGIVEGDQVIEWNGRSFQDATFEEAKQIMANSGDTVQLVLAHSRGGDVTCISRKESKPALSKSRRTSTANEKEIIVKDIKQKLLTALMERDRANEAKKANGEEGCDEARRIQGRMNLKLVYDAGHRCLSVTINRCQDLATRPGRDAGAPRPYVKLTVLPKHSVRHSSRTKALPNTCDPEWDHNFTLEDISVEKLSGLSLLLTVWDDCGLEPDCFLGEVLLDLSSADVQGGSAWFPLQEHDQNCGRMPSPSPKYLLVKRQPVSADDNATEQTPEADVKDKRETERNSRSLPSTPAHNIVKDFIHRKVFDRDSSVASASGHQSQNGKKKVRRSRFGDLKRRVTEMAMKVNTALQDKWETSSVPEKDNREADEKNNKAGTKVNRHRRTSHASSAGSSADSASANKASSLERILVDIPSASAAAAAAADADDLTTMLGPGQVLPKVAVDKSEVRGDIKLGLMISKGQLEVDVICAKGLRVTAAGLKPDTYVKTSLIGSGGKRLQKKKTKTVRATAEPLYVYKLKYSACNVLGRHLQVQIKERKVGFDKGRCLGELLIKLDNLDLTTYTTGWYRLFKESSIDLGSSDSVEN